MHETPYKENPDLPAPDTVVEKYSLAEHMARAADPEYEKLIKGGRDLSINQATEIGIKIGESMEAARHAYLAHTAGTEALVNTVATSEPKKVLEAPSFDPVETRQKNFETNLGIFQDTISDIFSTIRDAEDYPRPEEGERHDGLWSTQELTLYDPAS